MKVSERTIAALGKIATGDPLESTDQRVAPYQSGPQLVRFFNEFGGNAVYGKGFPSRWNFAEEKIRSHNGTPTLAQIVEALVDPRRFLNTELQVEAAVAFANGYLSFDGFGLAFVGQVYKLRSTKGVLVVVEAEPAGTEPLTHEFIHEQISKCDRKLSEGDFSGAITNARSMVEAVLISLENQLSAQPEDFDGDLPKLYRRVQKLVRLEPSRQDISDHLKAVLSGLNSIVHGLAPISNKMSDRHAAVLHPSKHHAKLAVNAAKTLVDFLFDTYEYQSARGLLKPAGTDSREASP